MDRETGNVMSVDIYGNYPTRFINTSIGQFVTCLYLVSRERAQFKSLSDADIDCQVSDVQQAIMRVDSTALHNDDNWWAIVIEQMNDGLL